MRYALCFCGSNERDVCDIVVQVENSGPENGLSDSSIVKEGGHVQVHCVEMPLNYVNPDFCIVECFDLPHTKETLIKALNAAKSLAEGLDNVRYAVSMHVHAYVTCSHSPACFVPHGQVSSSGIRSLCPLLPSNRSNFRRERLFSAAAQIGCCSANGCCFV